MLGGRAWALQCRVSRTQAPGPALPAPKTRAVSGHCSTRRALEEGVGLEFHSGPPATPAGSGYLARPVRRRGAVVKGGSGSDTVLTAPRPAAPFVGLGFRAAEVPRIPLSSLFHALRVSLCPILSYDLYLRVQTFSYYINFSSR